MGSAEFQAVLKLLDIVVAASTTLPEVLGKYQAVRSKIDQMVAEGRDPTPEEWADLDADIEESRDALRQYN